MKNKIKIFLDSNTNFLESQANRYAKDNNCTIVSASISAKPNGDFCLVVIFAEDNRE